MNDEHAPQPPGAGSGSASDNPGIAPEVSRRIASILDAVEREATSLREEARAEAVRYVEQARLHADGLVAERQRRIAELSAELIGKSEAIISRLDDAAPVRQGFENLVRALGEAAERLSQVTDPPPDAYRPPPYPPPAAAPAPQTPQVEPHQRAYEPPPAYQPPAEYRSPPAQGPPPAYPPPPPPAYQPPPVYEPPPAYQPPPAYEPPARYTPPPTTAPPTPTHLPPDSYPTWSRPDAAPETYPPSYEYPEAETTPQDVSDQPHPARAPSDPEWQAVPSGAVAAAEPAPAGWSVEHDAKTIAIRMAAASATRGGVREHLQQALGLSEAETILDEVFGAGTDDDSQVPWSNRPS